MSIQSNRGIGLVWLIGAMGCLCTLSGCNAHLPKADQSPANVRVAATSPPSPEPTELHAARLFRISQNTKIGYIDRTGNIVIQPQFDAGRDFSEGLAAIGKIAERTVGGVRTPELRWGFINERGQIVIPAKFTYAGKFSDGLAWVETGDKNGIENYGIDKHGYIDSSGKMVISSRLNFIFEPHGVDDGRADFHEGLAVIRTGRKEGFLDKTGRIAITPRFDVAYSFSEGLAVVQVGDKYGYVDHTGKIIIEPAFDFAHRFSEGVASIEIGSKYGYIDRTGTIIRGPEYSKALPFSEGLAAVTTDTGTRFVDRTFHSVIEVSSGSCGPFSEGLAAVGGWKKEGYIDRTGSLIISLSAVSAEIFDGGLARVCPQHFDEWGYINKSGEFVWHPTR